MRRRKRKNFEQYPHETTAEEFPRWETGAQSQRCRVDGHTFSGVDAGHVLHMKADAGDDRQKVLQRDFEQPLTGRWAFEFKRSDISNFMFGRRCRYHYISCQTETARLPRGLRRRLRPLAMTAV